MSARLSTGLAARLLRAHVGRRAEDHPRLRHRGRRDRRRLRDSSATTARAGSIAFARPKSSTFTVPSARTLMFAGFRSRWMIPCSCAASSASAICFAIGSASSSGNRARARCAATGPRPRPVPSRGPCTPSVCLEPVDRGDVGMIQRRERLRLRAANRASRSASLANASGSTLIATSRFELRVASPDRPRPCRRRRSAR